mmetsp:Transcript_11502/g.36727  ORF Transcript_11502/g.36727 Transcript_11502/m.36727 type:complete len:216 (-) Transcript_11502:1115-1762(-)
MQPVTGWQEHSERLPIHKPNLAISVKRSQDGKVLARDNLLFLVSADCPILAVAPCVRTQHLVRLEGTRVGPARVERPVKAAVDQQLKGLPAGGADQNGRNEQSALSVPLHLRRTEVAPGSRNAEPEGRLPVRRPRLESSNLLLLRLRRSSLPRSRCPKAAGPHATAASAAAGWPVVDVAVGVIVEVGLRWRHKSSARRRRKGTLHDAAADAKPEA